MRGRLRQLQKHFFSFKGALYSVLLLIGVLALLLAGILIWRARSLQAFQDQLISMLISIGASLIVVFLVEFCRKFVEAPDLDLFKEFFGDAAVDDSGYPTIFSRFRAPDWGDPRDQSNLNNLKVPDPPADGKGTFPKGIGHLIPFEDLSGVLEIDAQFRKHGGRLSPEVDRYKTGPLPTVGCISIGLGYNNVTFRLGEKSNELFHVQYDKETGSDYLLLRNNSGLCAAPASEKKDEDYGLIARVLVRKGKTAVPYIVCAGHTASGTVGASEYLAENWDRLARLYEQNDKRLDGHNLAVLVWITQHTGDFQRCDEPRFVEAK